MFWRRRRTTRPTSLPALRRVGNTVIFECALCGGIAAAGRHSYDPLLRCDDCRVPGATAIP